MTLPVKQHGSGKRQHGKWSHNPLIVAVIPALIIAAGGYLAGAHTGHVLGIAAAPTVTDTVTVTAPASGNGGGISNAPGQSNTPGQEIARKTGVQLTNCYALSFTDLSMRPYQVTDCYQFPSGDLSIDDYGYVQSGAELAIYSGQAGFSQCEADTTYVGTGSFVNPNHQRLAGSTLCITTGNRMVTCYVTDDTTSESIAAPGLIMDVTVYALK